MPVQAIPLAPFGIKGSSAAKASKTEVAATTESKSLEVATANLSAQDPVPSRPGSPGDISRAPTPTVPTTELAAKVAILNTRLEGIKSLFSIEVALKLVHIAKESLERAAQFAKITGQTGEEA